MIRKLEKEDIDEVMKIWLDTNINTHDFIDENYWKDHFEDAKNGILNVDSYVYEENKQIVGFIGVIDGYIAGIFVKKDMQGRGFGKQLIDNCKQKYKRLSLYVYEKNTKAIEFYKNMGFEIVKKGIDKPTKEEELYMKWTRK